MLVRNLLRAVRQLVILKRRPILADLGGAFRKPQNGRSIV